MLHPLTLVLGGARSGKSRHAEGLLVASGLRAVYVATARPLDGEMAARIAHHRAGRDDRWTTIEAPLDLAATIARESNAHTAILVDCLTLWLMNLFEDGRDPPNEAAALISALGTATGPVVLVANEIGLGLVPETALGRAFRDEAGRLNQRLAACADRVVFIAAGLPLVLKEPSADARGS